MLNRIFLSKYDDYQILTYTIKNFNFSELLQSRNDLLTHMCSEVTSISLGIMLVLVKSDVMSSVATTPSWPSVSTASRGVHQTPLASRPPPPPAPASSTLFVRTLGRCTVRTFSAPSLDGAVPFPCRPPFGAASCGLHRNYRPGIITCDF